MNIPLDRLYHYIESISEKIYGDRVIIYRFWPHGSKNIHNLNSLYEVEWYKYTISPAIWCNDQEPLDHEFYKTPLSLTEFSTILKSLNVYNSSNNLNHKKTIFEKTLLLHSEKRSNNLKKYQLDNELIPVYYWSHSIIARDWFRYAEHETFQKDIKKIFLIYNRAWSGTREYRLKFLDYLIQHKLVNQCQTSCNPVDTESNLHYSNYKFNNSQWQPTNILEDFLQPTTADATSSADFNTNDYNSTDIEVVLETLFDDDRLHLTEKSLRPIACSQPFILAGTHGSLEYLRSYGFKTFNTIWDESYDQIVDPKERLMKIVDLMQNIANWTLDERLFYMEQAQAIADYNCQWFFSQDFFEIVINELQTNLKLAFDELKKCNNYQPWIDRWNNWMSYTEVSDFLKNNQNQNLPTLNTVNQVLLIAQSRLTELANKNKI